MTISTEGGVCIVMLRRRDSPDAIENRGGQDEERQRGDAVNKVVAVLAAHAAEDGQDGKLKAAREYMEDRVEDTVTAFDIAIHRHGPGERDGGRSDEVYEAAAQANE